MTSASRWQPPSSSSSSSPSSTNTRLNSQPQMMQNIHDATHVTSMEQEHTLTSTISTKRQRTDDGNKTNSGNDHFKPMNERGYQRTQPRGYISDKITSSSNMNRSSSRGFDQKRRYSHGDVGNENDYRYEKHHDFWECKECHKSNHYRDDFCVKCDARRPPVMRYERGERDRGDRERGNFRRRDRHSDRFQRGNRSQSDSYGDRERYDRRDMDNDRRYGSRSRSVGRKSRQRKDDERNPMVTEWPPPFESDGAAYIFDPRSGFFYEGASDFFYDPKNKLYYGNKKKAYFKYVSGETPGFCPIQNPQKEGLPEMNMDVSQTNNLDGPQSQEKSSSISPTDSSSNILQMNADPNETKDLAKTNGKEKMKIAITIKKKKVASVVNNLVAVPIPKATPNAGTVSITQKKHSADIDKWAERGREIRSDSQTENSLNDKNVTLDKSNADAVSICSKASKSPMFGKTKHGKPACLLCKRKFADMEKLKEHIKRSLLHKQKLAEKEALEKKEREAVEYRDRAQERRFMYEPETSFPNKDEENLEGEALLHSSAPSLTQARSVVNADVVNPNTVLHDSNNIGNKMLQKLGWKSGASLGRNKDDPEKAESVNDKLRKDWEKIEAIAIAGGNGKRGEARGGVGL